MNGYWVIRTYTSGSVGEKIKYWVSGVKPVRSSRRMSSDVNKLEKNEKQSEKNLARILNTNFGAQGGVLVGLDYSDEAYSKLFLSCKNREEVNEEAKHQVSLCLRRVQRVAKERGIEVKAVIVTADRDGETQEEVRVHHHIVVNKEAAELFGEKLGEVLKGGEVVAYFGGLGMGKTCFTRGLARGLGFEGDVTSPKVLPRYTHGNPEFEKAIPGATK